MTTYKTPEDAEQAAIESSLEVANKLCPLLAMKKCFINCQSFVRAEVNSSSQNTYGEAGLGSIGVRFYSTITKAYCDNPKVRSMPSEKMSLLHSCGPPYTPYISGMIQPEEKRGFLSRLFGVNP